MRFLFWTFLILVFTLRYITTQPTYKDGDKVRISAKVTSEPVRYSTAQYLKLQGLSFYLPIFPEIYYGDSVVVDGVVSEGELKEPVLVNITSKRGILANLRLKLVDFYHKSLPEPHASLVAGVTIGSKASIPQEFWEVLKQTSTAHVVVASGMNVTLVAGFLISIFVLFFPRPKAVAFSLIGIWLYALLSGFDAPIIRAAIMGSIAFIAQGLGRLNIAWRALILSALLMLIVKPQWVWDLGFILSFVATASLMLFEARIRRRLQFVPNFIRQDLSTSLAAQIGVAPIIFATFGQFNILSPVINALVLWTIAPITIIGMLAGILSIISIQLGRVVLWISYPLTLWFVKVVELFA